MSAVKPVFFVFSFITALYGISFLPVYGVIHLKPYIPPYYVLADNVTQLWSGRSLSLAALKFVLNKACTVTQVADSSRKWVL